MSSDSSGFQTNHQDSLTGLCRICEERARRKYEKTIPKLWVVYKRHIIQVHWLNINGDDTDKHATRMCNRWYTVMKKITQDKRCKYTGQCFSAGDDRLILVTSYWTELQCVHSLCGTGQRRKASQGQVVKKRQREASATFDPPDCSTPPQKQSTLVADAQTSPFQLKTLPILQDADAMDLTERSSFVDCQTSPIKQLQSESVTWVTLLVKERKNIVWLGIKANCHQPPMMQTEFISRWTHCVL